MRRIFALALAASVSGCAPARLAPTLAVRAAIKEPTARRLEIQRKLAPICPAPLSDAALDRMADYAEAHPDKDALAIVNDAARLDAEARICRGMKIKG